MCNEEDAVLEKFIARYGAAVTAVLSGFDRLVFRGTLLPLVWERGMHTFLARAGVRLLDFRQYALRTTEQLITRSVQEAVNQHRPIPYVPNSKVDKEALARRLLKEHPLQHGLICMFRALEPCMTFEYHRAQDPAHRGLRLKTGKCLHLYKYYLHPRFGFIGSRIQTWFPFNIQIWLNGREWLACQLQRRGVTDFTRCDNCFTRLGNPALAQRLMDRQLTIAWRPALDAIARKLNPLHQHIFKSWPLTYYWSAYQSEWATDVLFRDANTLAALYPTLVRHAMLHFHSPDVMRFLGRKGLHGSFQGELNSRLIRRLEATRIKHWVQGNSVKMYDKAGNCLRVETTIAKTKAFKVLRPLHGQSRSTVAWRTLRTGIADLHRRAQVSQQANDNYLNALAAVDDDTPLHLLFDRVSRPLSYHGRRVRALRIGDPNDLALLAAVAHGEFATAGFRNRDLRAVLYPVQPHCSPAHDRRLSARVSRQLRLLRAHGVIRKIPRSHRYQLTHHGRLLAAALFATRQSTIAKLIGSAAA